MAQLAHHVFFTLHDNSDAACEGLVEACYKYLKDHTGVTYFSAGRRVPDLNRPVNDGTFDVSLHVVFADRSAHDVYQEAPLHKEFIASQSKNWAEVRVFDSDLAE